MDEAIGRCTEMGRPVHFSPGIGDVQNAQTLAAMSILGYVAKQCARYDTDIIATNRNIIVYPISEEIVKQAYAEVGKVDAFKVENVRWISDDQFAYATGVTGIMFREKPAANILVGAFWAESLVFAEVGATAGAIQISGTANTHQIPFFVAACDYCLIGEELTRQAPTSAGNPCFSEASSYRTGARWWGNPHSRWYSDHQLRSDLSPPFLLSNPCFL